MNDKESPKVTAKGAGAPRAPSPAATPSTAQTASSLMRKRWFAPAVLAGVALIAFGVFRLSQPSERTAAAAASAAPPDPLTTGRLVVKSNRADTIIEATRVAPTGETAGAGTKGTSEGAASQELAGLPAGKYVLTARSEGWPEVRREVNVAAGGATEVAVQFKSGSLRLDSDPTGATVRRGETVLGQTPFTIPQLPPGECQLSIQYPAWPALNFKTTITENVESAETVRLPHGKLTVETTPAGATVRLEGRSIGQTPLTVERIPAGPKKLTLQAKDFPTLEVSGTVEDHGEMKVNVALGSGFPELDPPALLRAVWVADNPDKLSPQFDTAGVFQPQNGIVKNLHRKRLYEGWLRRSYHFSGAVKSYDPVSGQIEFAEQKSELSKYRVMAKLSPGAREAKDRTAQLVKGATFEIYGRLSAVEEPRWPLKVITFEISAAEPLR